MSDDYDAQDDLAKSLDEGYRAIRKRKAKGGPGWVPATTVAGKAAAEVHGADKAGEIAERLKDPQALKEALIRKLHAERDFAAIYRQQFPDGGDRRSEGFQTDSAVRLNGDDWCLGFGFHVRTVRRWLELLLPDKLEKKETAVVQKCWELAELWHAANYSSESNEWYTPGQYLEAVREVLGQIDLDPASNPQANTTVGAKQIFTAEQDGLRRKWSGRVFMNPPYGRTAEGSSMAGAFCAKAVAEYEAGNVEAAIVLVNSLHSQAWQAPLYDYVVCLVNHRIKFVAGDGEENKNPTFQNIFIYLGKEVEKFAAAFSRFGYVMRKVD